MMGGQLQHNQGFGARREGETSAQPLQCPKCGGEMATGFIVDAVAGLKRRNAPIWIEGEAIWSAVWGYQTKGRSR
jgi:hypothetical protein